MLDFFIDYDSNNNVYVFGSFWVLSAPELSLILSEFGIVFDESQRLLDFTNFSSSVPVVFQFSVSNFSVKYKDYSISDGLNYFDDSIYILKNQVGYVVSTKFLLSSSRSTGIVSEETLRNVVQDVLNNILSNRFVEVSLDGSNGAKFKDGDVVKVKGFLGDFKVVASQYIVNNDNVATVMYKVQDLQTNKIHYVPQVFLIPSNSQGG